MLASSTKGGEELGDLGLPGRVALEFSTLYRVGGFWGATSRLLVDYLTRCAKMS